MAPTAGAPASAAPTADGDGDRDRDGDPTTTAALGRGMRVGRYVLEELLGVGGMSVVHAAFDSELHRRVAVKLLRTGLGGRSDSQGGDRLMAEARALARLAHPNVVTVFEVGARDGELFLAMELVDGGSLRAWLERAPRATGDILACLYGVARGLAAAHAAGIVHRDIKPDNILVGLDGRARVTDFGLAAPPGTTPTAMLVGTPAYMAPEQRRRGVADARSDQWSFCATVYEALAGVRPFAVDHSAARRAAIEGGRLAAPAPGRKVPSWVRRIVARGLHPDPGARWPSMDAVACALALGLRWRWLATLAAPILALATAAISDSTRPDRG